jgi:glucose-1-phosphate adenylyltransferase
MVFKPMDCGRPSRFGIGVIEAGGRVVRYEEKPRDPPSDLASLTIYLFRYEVLAARLRENAATGTTFHLYDEVIPRMVREDRVMGFVFDGGWEYLRPLDAWYDTHMRMLSPEGFRVPMDRVVTNPEGQGLGDASPAFFAPGAEVLASLVPPGCRIHGTVRRSVLFPGVVVEPGAIVEDSVLVNDVRVGSGTVVSRAVVDKGCVLGSCAVVGGHGGVTALGKEARVVPGGRIAAGSEVPAGSVAGVEGER